ncbi:aspartate ammonia-lyase [Kitasatospora indigofera]|uniref:aspartate ammonia-lyase n=1 Tax=Kitasatospora indigofera TaxID=67307 RepID=UPI0036C79072
MNFQRLEHDLIGDRYVPAETYYGIHTLRAVENFPLSGIPISAHPEFVVALAEVKLACARANAGLGTLDAARERVIVAAADEVRQGLLHEHFVVDVLQGGAGTSSNMNANEVIANRALELMGRRRGEYGYLSPNDHVNLGQSTNDAYPTAAKLALHAAAGALLPAMGRLADSFAERAHAFADVVKLGRTQLQDAVPMTLGQEFTVFALTVRDDRDHLERAAGGLCEVNLGGTAIGTGLNAAPGFAGAAVRELAELTGVAVRPARDLIEATQGVGAFLYLASSLKSFAVRLSKICNDLRLLASGPQAGLAEIRLPALQAGSSIMPGKVNPVVPEAVNQVCFDVVGVEAAVALAGQSGQLQLNAFEPLMVHLLLTALNRLEHACDLLASRCVAGIETDAGRLLAFAEGSAVLATALNPVIGYHRATQVAQQSVAQGRSVREIVQESGVVPAAELADLLDPMRLVGR